MAADTTNRSKTIAKNTIVLYIRMIVIMGITLITSRVILQALGETDFGIFNVIGGLILFLGFFTSSLSNATQRFLNIEMGLEREDMMQKVFTTSFFSFFFLSLFFVITFEVVGLWLINNFLSIPPDRYDATLWVFHCSVFSFFFTINSISFVSSIIAREDFRIYAYVGIIDAVLKLLIAVMALYQTQYDNLKYYAILFLATTIIVQLIYIIYGYLRYPECRITLYWNKELFTRLSKFIGWNALGTAVFALNNQGINLLLNNFFGVSVNAARAVSSQVESAVNKVSEGFITASKPQVVKLYAIREDEQIAKITYFSSKLSFFLMLLIALPLVFQRDYVLKLWLVNPPEYASVFVVWGLIYCVINSMTLPSWNAIQAVGQLKKYTLVGSLVFAAAFPISLIALLITHEPIAPLVVLCLVRLVYIFVVTHILGQYLPINIQDFTKQVLYPVIKVSVVATAITFLIVQVISQGTFVSLIIITILCVLSTLGTIFYIGLQKEDRKKVMHKLSIHFNKN